MSIIDLGGGTVEHLIQVLPEQLQAIRKMSGLTQSELAKAVIVTKNTVSNWETGNTVPDAHDLLRMSGILHLSVDAILGVDVANLIGVHQLRTEDLCAIQHIIFSLSERNAPSIR